MKKIIGAALLLTLMATLSGCFESQYDNDLRGVPVTNNPNLLPRTQQTAQAPSFGN